MAHLMTTKELARYLRFHEITICKYAAEGQIPAMRIGRVWRFDKDVIDAWIRTGQNETKPSVNLRDRRLGIAKIAFEFILNLLPTTYMPSV